MARSKSQAKATAKFEREAYDHLHLRLRKDSEINNEYLRKYTESKGMSVNGFILKAIEEKIARDSGV